MAVLVLSGPENFGKRQKLRELTVPGFRLTFLFLVGLKTSNLDRLLKQVFKQFLSKVIYGERKSLD